MSRKSKVWLTILGVPLLLAIAGIIALNVVFTDERLKSMVIPRVEEMTGRKVSIEKIGLNLFPSIALTMDGLALSNLPEPGFSSEPFLALESLRLNVKLLPLLGSRVEVTSLVLEKPRLVLEVSARGKANYSNLTSGGKPPDAADAAKNATDSSLGMALSVSSLQVNNGYVTYLDHKDSSLIRLQHFNLSMEIGGDAKTVVLTGVAASDSLSYGTVAATLVEGWRLGFDHRILYDVAKDRVVIEKGDLSLQNLHLSLTGTVADASANSILDLTLGSDSLNIADLFSLIPGEYQKRAEGAKGTGVAKINIAMTGTLTDSTTAEVAGTIKTTGASIQYPQLPKPITDISIQSHFARTKANQEFAIDKMTANLGGTPIRLAMTVRDFDDPLLTLDAGGVLNLATVRDYYPLEEGTELGGTLKLDVQLAGKVSNPTTMRAQGAMEFRDVSARTATLARPVKQLNGIIALNNEVVESKKLSMVIGGSDMTLSWKARNYLSLLSDDKKAPRASATMALQSNHLSMRDISKEDSGIPAGGGQTPSSKEGKQTALTLPNVDMDVTVGIGTLTLEKFEFSNVRGSVHIANGLITMQNLSMNAFGGSVVTTGTIDLAKAEQSPFDLKLNVNAVQAGAMLSPFTSFGQRLNGALSMNTTMKGSLNDTLGLIASLLQGNGTVAINDGTLKGMKINQSLASTLSLPDLENVQFKNWANDFTVENGRLVIKDLSINALNAQYVVNGSQGLDGSLDYELALYLPESAGARIKVAGFAGDAVDLFKDQSGRLKLDFNVGGSMDNPKLQLDSDSARRRVEAQAKQKIEAEKEKLEKQIKEKAGDALKKLFKR
jgi:uncharacterized protein involved in outer membrane biogenesis